MKKFRVIWKITGSAILPTHLDVEAKNEKEAVIEAGKAALARGWQLKLLTFDRVELLSEPEPKKFSAPTVHLNGTSRAELLDQLSKAYSGCRIASDALRAAWPNARDYYVQGDDAFSKAVKEWESRIERLNSVKEELLTIANTVQEAGS